MSTQKLSIKPFSPVVPSWEGWPQAGVGFSAKADL